MGSPGQITVVGTDESGADDLRCALRAARGHLAALERCWSRFIPTSDISRLNTARGTPVAVDPSTVQLVIAMIEAWRATGGAFDPTLLGALVSLGYAADWDDPCRVSLLDAGSCWRGAPDSIMVDTGSSVVTLPFGTTLDGGGIGKGLAVDLAVGAALDEGAAGALVSLGGDLRVGGHAPQPGGWMVGVADPRDETRELAQVSLLDGGVATSGTLKRRWTTPDGLDVHHLIDPSTGLPARARARDADPGSALVSATIIAGSAAWAEAWTKAVMVLGADDAFPRLDRMGLAAFAVDAAGGTRANRVWATFDAESSISSSGGGDA